MAKPKPTASTPTKAAAKSATAAPVQSHAIRETVESIVIAFVLAFLFRTFEAEAFVIPTGSMAPTLMGRHKDVVCPKCNYRYQVSASEEESEDQRHQTSDCIAGKCPMCQYVLPMRPDLPDGVPERQLAETHWREDNPTKADRAPNVKDLATYIPWQSSYNGDRILVNKYIYSFSDPKRWDVVVFKFPGDAKVNYIKRLVGLPGEKLRIFQGDVFLGKEGSDRDEDYAIIRKPPSKILSMRQLVHDTKYDSAELDAMGWPLRWSSSADNGARLECKKETSGKNVRQEYSVDASDSADSWLRYENLTPTYKDWQDIADAGQRDPKQPLFATADRARWRRLITDSNPYDGRVDRSHMVYPSLQIEPIKTGLHWVSDLMLEAAVDIQSAKGELLLDLVKGGRHFTCHVDVATGEAKLSITGLADFSPTAKTALKGPSKHQVAFSNFDDQLLLWVDGSVASFEGATTYDADKVFGKRESIRPETSAKDLGDFAPAGIGARGAKVSVSNLQVWRDLYYIADDYQRMKLYGGPVTDFNHPFENQVLELPTNPSLWDLFGQRHKADFTLNGDQLFVMGDNSAESSDARLWVNGNSDRGKPGGPYLDRRLLIGKALCVYWPHSWNQIPGTPIPFPLFPNIADMRLVR